MPSRAFALLPQFITSIDSEYSAVFLRALVADAPLDGEGLAPLVRLKQSVQKRPYELGLFL